jgi:hypothetical protein
MPGVEVFSRINFGKETTKGTAVARTRRFYGVAAGNLDIGDQWNFHETENRGSRVRVSAHTPTLTREMPKVKLQDIDGIGYDDLVLPLSIGFQGGRTGVGGAADKTWTFTQPGTGSGAYESMSVDIGDDIQNYILDYVMPTRWQLSTDFGGKTHFEADCFAQQVVKGAASAPAEINPILIPSDLWTVKFAGTFAGLAGASVQTNFLRTWSLEYLTGITPRWYMDGNMFLGQHVETDIAATVSLEVESTALAVSEFVDKYRAGTLDYMRLKATGPALGGTNYSLQIDMPLYWNEPKPLSSVDEGVNLYTVEGKQAFDGTNGMVISLVGSLAAIP